MDIYIQVKGILVLQDNLVEVVGISFSVLVEDILEQVEGNWGQDIWACSSLVVVVDS